MKLAITADVHLSGRGTHPERSSALEDILRSCAESGVEQLIIAGDLFDLDCGKYSEFEEIARKHQGVQFHVIPGNHDPDISGNVIVGGNVRVYSEPTARSIGGLEFVFLPYSGTSGMGEHLEDMKLPSKWVLVGHGDFISGKKERNPYETGTYMPLYRMDLERYSPWRVFLGHIHRSLQMDRVYYPGSPCGIDINETGRRSYLIFDTSTGRSISVEVDTEVIFFNEKFLVIPDEREIERLREQARARKAAWGLDRTERGKARIRIKARGYSSSRERVMECLLEEFGEFSYCGDEKPDISALRFASDHRRNAIARRTIDLIGDMSWEFGGDEPEREDVIEAALSVIYGDGS